MSNELMTSAEAEIMEYIWSFCQDGKKITARDISEHFAHKHWRKATVSTFLKNLLKKDMVTLEIDGKTYYYTPATTRDEYALRPAREVVRTSFGGSFRGFFSSFIGSDRVTKDEIAELREWLENLDDE